MAQKKDLCVLCDERCAPSGKKIEPQRTQRPLSKHGEHRKKILVCFVKNFVPLVVNKNYHVYPLSVTEIEEHKILEIADNAIQNFKEIIMSTYERIYTKGEENGIEKGIEKGKVDSLLKGFDNGLSISLFSNISDFSEDEVVRILQENGKMK